jgi:hypothetical protein
VGPSGQIVTSTLSTISPSPLQAASAQISRQALPAPARSRSCWNTGMTSVTSV